MKFKELLPGDMLIYEPSTMYGGCIVLSVENDRDRAQVLLFKTMQRDSSIHTINFNNTPMMSISTRLIRNQNEF